MRKAATIGLLVGLLTLLATAPAQAEFGLTNFKGGFFDKGGQPEREAGAHPYEVRTSFEVETRVDPELGLVPDGAVKAARFFQPAGFIGSRTTVPRCATADFLTIEGTGYNHCPNTTAIGVVLVRLSAGGKPTVEPVYNLVPPPGVAAKFGFTALNTPTTVEVGVNDRQPFNLVASTINIPQTANFYGAELRLWGTPADHSHDPFRGNCLSLVASEEPISKDVCDTGAEVVPWLTMPRSCTGQLLTSYEAVSWQQPNAPPNKGSFTSPGMTGCSKLNLAAAIKSKPTVATAESASGLDFDVEIKDEGLYNPNGPATQSDIKKAVVTLPAGMTANPSQANGLAVCSKAGYEAETLASAPGQGCPNASKIAEVEATSPLLAEGETLNGSVFLASQDDNPFGTLIALYMVFKSPELGVLVKLPAKVEPNEERGPNAGRLVTTVDDAPQMPVSSFRFHFTGGARGALLTPPACGTYVSEALFSPWSDPSGLPVKANASFDITAGVAGGPCPAGGVPPFNPGFSAGSINNNAGAYSPFNMRLTRADGDQEMTRFDAVLPRGVTGKLAGVIRCPDSAIATAKAKTGRQELANPSCPAASEIGRTLTGAGVGAVLTYVPGKLYLGGPVGKAPLSVIAITPAVAGPFDVGTVVVREALTVDPDTADVKVDGALSDPIPNILRGLPVKLKDLRVYTDRPNFTLNPTSCAQKQAKATLFGSFLDPFSSADDRPAELTDRYQAASCASLKFKPKLSLRLKGGTKRGAHPALRATLTYPKGAGYANIKKAVATLPHSAFLDQAHIRTVCTRVQFAAENCPKGSIYGKARAFTPLLDEPLEGPVYLRSSSNPLPDLVVALKGIVDFNLVGRVDSVNASIRTTFASAPDAPVSKFVLEMQGGKKGLLINSRNLCVHKSRATAELTAHNGRISNTRPVVVAAGCGGKKRK